MILAKIKDAAQYRGICVYLDRALERFESDLPGLTPGHVEIDGNNLYLNCFDYESLPESETMYEAHDHMGDIHICLKGEEKVYIAETTRLREVSRNREGDVFMLEGDADQVVILREGDFLVVFPGDAHRIKMQVNGPCAVRKAVYKFKL